MGLSVLFSLVGGVWGGLTEHATRVLAAVLVAQPRRNKAPFSPKYLNTCVFLGFFFVSVLCGAPLVESGNVGAGAACMLLCGTPILFGCCFMFHVGVLMVTMLLLLLFFMFHVEDDDDVLLLLLLHVYDEIVILVLVVVVVAVDVVVAVVASCFIFLKMLFFLLLFLLLLLLSTCSRSCFFVHVLVCVLLWLWLL